MKIYYIASEVAPYAKTGGLADVAGALPPALSALGHDVRLIMPLYSAIDPAAAGLQPILPEIKVYFPGETQVGRIHAARMPDGRTPIYFVDHPGYFHREGLYQDRGGDFADNAERFGFFCMAALWALRGLDWRPDIIWCNDWQTGLAPAFLANLSFFQESEFYSHARRIFTIHNLAFQGLFDSAYVAWFGLPWSAFTMEGMEYYGQVNLLKSGIVYSDAITTVSRQYAEEIQCEEFGCGLDGVLRARHDSLTGILNGIDDSIWNPETDPLIPATYSARDMAGKAACKAALQRKLGLPADPGMPLVGAISRLADQKGFDLVAKAAASIMAHDVQFVLLGTGAERYHDIFERLAREFPDRAAIRLAFDNTLAHEIEAASDMFLMPSRYEPCGLNQLYSLRYGAVPIARRVGGLADSIVDPEDDPRAATGFLFREYSHLALLEALQRALRLYRDDPAGWDEMRRRGMRQDFSWRASAQEYEKLLLKLKNSPSRIG